MFNNNQIEKIKDFSTACKVHNYCFQKCSEVINLDDNSTLNKCIDNCSKSYFELYLNYRKFLKEEKIRQLESNQVILLYKT